MPRKNREAISMLRGEGMARSEAERHAHGNWPAAFLDMRVQNTTPLVHLEKHAKELHQKNDGTKRQMKTSVRPDLIEVLDAISGQLHIPRQELVELLLFDALGNRFPESMQVISEERERRDHAERLAAAYRSGYRTSKDDEC